MRILLDTHVFIWWMAADPRFPAQWVPSVIDPANTVFLSAATAWEIASKRRSGKLAFEHALHDADDVHGFEWLAIDQVDAERAGSLEWSHPDPFDRMLVAQAARHDLVLATADAAVRTAATVRFL